MDEVHVRSSALRHRTVGSRFREDQNKDGWYPSSTPVGQKQGWLVKRERREKERAWGRKSQNRRSGKVRYPTEDGVLVAAANVSTMNRQKNVCAVRMEMCFFLVAKSGTFLAARRSTRSFADRWWEAPRPGMTTKKKFRNRSFRMETSWSTPWGDDTFYKVDGNFFFWIFNCYRLKPNISI